MAVKASSLSVGRLLQTGREFFTHWAIAGAFIALTGFAPDHWLAHLFTHFSLPPSLRESWLGVVDLRVVLVAIGVAIISWDVLRRNGLATRQRNTGQAVVSAPGEASEAWIVDRHPSPASAAISPGLPDKPSIAVLPFDNMSGDPGQEHFADGMAEDIITALSKVRWFFVISRNSSFTYRGKAVDLKQAGRELGVRYILEGSVRKAGDRIRLTAQLIDATSGHHVWAEHYDRKLADLFEVQDEITERVVAAIEPTLYAAEGIRTRRKPPESLDAWECVIRALSLINSKSKADAASARRMLEKAIALDPGYAEAHSLLAYAIALGVLWGWERREDAIPRASEAAQQALKLDAHDPWAHLVAGYVLVCEKRP